MALTIRAIQRNCYYLQNITKPVRWSIKKNYPLRIFASSVCNNHEKHTIKVQDTSSLLYSVRYFTTQTQGCGSGSADQPSQEPAKKPGLVQRFKQMYRDYWYVLLPVHMTTSTIWFGSSYYLVRSGVDVLGWLESMGLSDTLLSPLRDSSAGYFALAFALYKVITPLRYAVTVGGTTYAIKKLTAVGWIKPVPSKERLKEMLQVKKDNFQDRFNESKQHYQVQMKEKSTHVMDEMRRYKTEIRKMKEKVRKM